MKFPSQWAQAISLGWLLGFADSRAAEPKPWSEKDTRLASEYLNMLVEKPEYGRVLDLLWELYDKHESGGLLLKSIEAQANARPHPDVLLVQAHLLRKAGRTDEAVKGYRAILEKDAKNAAALRSLADLLLDQGKREEALQLLQQLAATMRDDDPQRGPLLMEQGRIALQTGKRDDAAAAWDQAVRLQPDNAALVREVAQLFLGSGFLDRVLELHRQLAKSSDPAKKLDALYDLSRIEEQSDHFDEAAAALREGMALLHFRDWRYAQFFQRRVKLHERFGRLEALKNELLKATNAQPPQEQALADMARFAELTVDADERVKWLRELTAKFPAQSDYRWQLVSALIDHDGWSEAGAMLDRELKHDGSDAVALVLMRCLAHLRGGEDDKAAALLKVAIERIAPGGGDPGAEKQILSFAREKSLDEAAETLLKKRVAREPDKAEAVMELAGFYRSRQRGDEMQKVLDEYAAGARADRRGRLNQIAAFLSTGGDAQSAEKAARDAAQAPGAGRDEWLRLADVLAQRERVDEALPLLERAWSASDTPDKRSDVDERILALLSGEQAAPKPAAAAGATGEFKLPAMFTGEGFGADASATEKRAGAPEAVVNHALARAAEVFGAEVKSWLPRRMPAGLVRQYLEARILPLAGALPTPSPERVLRAAWWCLRAQKNDLAAALLHRLEVDAAGRPATAPLEAQKLWLELALIEKNELLAFRLLRLMAKIDPAGRVPHLLRLAEQELAREGGAGRDEAVRILEGLAKDDPQNISVLTALSQTYVIGGQADRALDLWRRAVRDAKGNATPALERYADALITQHKSAEFFDVSVQMLELETDPKRRRENFQRALDRLMWADTRQGEISEDEKKKRLEMAGGVLKQRAQRHPLDGFWHEAAAQVLDRQGDAGAAFEEMKRAYYTAPDTPFSLDQLRGAAMRAGDLRSAIYFQKQIAAGAAAKEQAGEWRELVQLLEQDFRIAEADQVRRMIESRYSQDPAALEELAKFYAETSQDDAARRVLGQIARLQPWEVKNLLRLALAQRDAGEAAAAAGTLRQILASTKAPDPEAARVAAERQPWPLFPERRGMPAGNSAALAALDAASALEAPERDRLRLFLSVPRDELAELPEEAAHIRLRAIEELAKLGGAGSLDLKDAVERAWALFFAGDAGGFMSHVLPMLGRRDSMEAAFVLLWLGLRVHAAQQAVAWAGDAALKEPVRAQRRTLFNVVLNMLADSPATAFTDADLRTVGNSGLLAPADLFELATKLEGRTRPAQALVLREAGVRQIAVPGDWVLLQLATGASAAGMPELGRKYLEEIWRHPVEAAPSRGFTAQAGRAQRGSSQERDRAQEAELNLRAFAQSVEAALPRPFDPFISSFEGLMRMARTPDEKAALMKDSWRRLRQVARSGAGDLREACVLGISGADEEAARRMADYFGDEFLAAHTFIEPLLGRLPPGVPMPGPRIDEVNHMRAYWDDAREWGTALRLQGLAGQVNAADERLGRRNAGTRAGYDIGTWRIHSLARRMHAADYPERMRMLREHLNGDDSVETLTELGSFLETQGFARECIDIYRRLPARAPSNSEYGESFVRVSEASWDFEAVLPYLAKIFDPATDPVFKPLTIPFERLRDQHARMLAMLHDLATLRQYAFEKGEPAKQGRVPDQVPYLRELALCLEREGDKPGALAAWEQLGRLWSHDEEAALHRARILADQGNPGRALEALRPLQAEGWWTEPSREALALRVKLAADAGLWEEIRELMNAVTTPAASPSSRGAGFGAAPVPLMNTGVVLALAREIAEHGRVVEAESVLVRAERGVKNDADRFLLRLEQIKLAAREPSWTPAHDAARIAALFRADSRDVTVLKPMGDWFAKEAESPRAAGWFELVNKCAPAPATALALASLGRAAAARPEHFDAERWKDAPRPLRALVVERLLERKQPALALRVADGRSPDAVRGLAALGDELALREVFAGLVRMTFPGGADTVEFAETFAATKHEGLAEELYSLALRRMEATAQHHPALVKSYGRFLVAQRRFEQAETMLLRHNAGVTLGLAEILADLYRGWNRGAQIEAELAKFHLPGAVRAEAVYQMRKGAGK